MSPFQRIYPGKNNRNGFSIIELLIAVSIFSVVSIAIYSTFNSGAAVLRRVKQTDLKKQNLLLKLERFAREFRTQPVYNKQVFLGKRNRISFPAISNYQPARVTYYFDESNFCLKRVMDDLSKIIDSEGKVEEELKGSPSVFLSKIENAQFTYLYHDLKSNEYTWLEEWNYNFSPVAVKLTIVYKNQEYVSTAILPK